MPTGVAPKRNLLGLSQYPTWKKYRVIHSSVARMSIRDKRHIFAILRTQPCTHETLLLPYGLTIGEFCCMNILTASETMR